VHLLANAPDDQGREKDLYGAWDMVATMTQGLISHTEILTRYLVSILPISYYDLSKKNHPMYFLVRTLQELSLHDIYPPKIVVKIFLEYSF
jgi:hypothetical protein